MVFLASSGFLMLFLVVFAFTRSPFSSSCRLVKFLALCRKLSYVARLHWLYEVIDGGGSSKVGIKDEDFLVSGALLDPCVTEVFDDR